MIGPVSEKSRFGPLNFDLRLPSYFRSHFHLFLVFNIKMPPNGTAVRAALAPGHFLFTSESVGEGHPGMLSKPRACHF